MDCQSAKTLPPGDAAIETSSASRESFFFRVTGCDQPGVWAEASREHKLRRECSDHRHPSPHCACRFQSHFRVQLISETQMPPIHDFWTRGILNSIVSPDSPDRIFDSALGLSTGSRGCYGRLGTVDSGPETANSRNIRVLPDPRPPRHKSPPSAGS